MQRSLQCCENTWYLGRAACGLLIIWVPGSGRGSGRIFIGLCSCKLPHWNVSHAQRIRLQSPLLQLLSLSYITQAQVWGNVNVTIWIHVIKMLCLWFTRHWHLFLLSLFGHAAITSSKNTQNWSCSICIKHIKWQEILNSQSTIKAHRLQIRNEVFTFQGFTHVHHKLKSA